MTFFFLPSVFSSHFLLKSFLLSNYLVLIRVYVAVHSYWKQVIWKLQVARIKRG